MATTLVRDSSRFSVMPLAIVVLFVPAWTGIAHGMAPGSSQTAQVKIEGQAETLGVIGYEKGLLIQSADRAFKLRLNGRVQARYTQEGTDLITGSFAVPRARIKLSGHVFSDRLGYKLELNFGKGIVALKDLFADYKAIPKWVHIRVGQYKRPFSRQQITSSGALEFVDRALTDKAFYAGRDTGVTIHNGYEESPKFEYAFGVFGGTGTRSQFIEGANVDPATGDQLNSGNLIDVPDKINPTFVVRIGYNYGGIKGYKEADLDGGPFRFGVAASGLAGLDADVDDTSLLLGQLDYTAKFYGFSTTGGVYTASTQNGERWINRGFDSVGLHVQTGYVIGQLLQPTIRYALLAPQNGDGANEHEVALGASFYLVDHRVKWATDGTAHMEDGVGTDYRIRTHLQLAF